MKCRIVDGKNRRLHTIHTIHTAYCEHYSLVQYLYVYTVYMVYPSKLYNLHNTCHLSRPLISPPAKAQLSPGETTLTFSRSRFLLRSVKKKLHIIIILVP